MNKYGIIGEVVTLTVAAERLGVKVGRLNHLASKPEAPVWRSGRIFLTYFPDFAEWYKTQQVGAGRPKKTENNQTSLDQVR